jgi:hypothetical protein
MIAHVGIAMDAAGLATTRAQNAVPDKKMTNKQISN